MKVANKILSYAVAIYSIAKEKPIQEKYYFQISALDAFNSTNTDFYDILSNRFIDKKERKDLAMKVLTGYGFEQKLIYWVWTIIDSNSYNLFHFIALVCRQMYHYIFGITKVKIDSAHELSEEQIDKIKDFFEKKLNRKIEIEWHIIPQLLGGLRIQVNNKTYNNTFKSKLETLKKELLVRKD